MAYFSDVFSPDTHEAFTASDRTVAGFRVAQRAAVSRVAVGDKLLCYLTKVSRWVGLLEVLGEPFDADAPIFVADKDPFTVRVKVKPLVWLPVEQGIPVHDDEVWTRLSFTKEHDRSSSLWTATVRHSLRAMNEADGKVLEELLVRQGASPKSYPLTENERRKLRTLRVQRPGGSVAVSVPDEPDEAEPEATGSGATTVRESIQIQALLARIGSKMGFDIWIPANDRGGVLSEWPAGEGRLVAQLPMNFDETTLRTIENIDVLWLKRRSIVRAFEVEHTTAIYSGILRMADLLALQPNMDIRLHLVAPEARKEKVFQEIRRPVFTLLEKAPLAELCTFISYDNLRELEKLPHLQHVSDSVLDDYEETAE